MKLVHALEHLYIVVEIFEITLRTIFAVCCQLQNRFVVFNKLSFSNRFIISYGIDGRFSS